MLQLNKWPRQSECRSYYGNPVNAVTGRASSAWAAENLTRVKTPWILTDGRNHFSTITIHKKCAESLARVLAATWNDCGHDEDKIHDLGYDVFSGSWVVRPMRTGKSLSMHSYGCAIDFDAPHNMLGDKTPSLTLDDPLVKNFLAEGWVWGGQWRGNNIDAMHFQAAIVG